MSTIRPVRRGDERRWRELFDDYNRFYGREPAEPVTAYTWQRLMDPASPVNAIVAEAEAGAEDGAGNIVGIANYLVHESTTQLRPVCLLQDLLVDQSQRGGGVGRQLIDWLIAEMKVKGWSKLYWHTRETNYRARGLYDQYTPHSGFLRYVIDNTP